jgi:predicted ferric reductase
MPAELAMQRGQRFALNGGRLSRRMAIRILGCLVLTNGGAVLWLWLHGGGLSLLLLSPGGLLTSLGRLTALVGTYLVLIQVILLARMPWLERVVGFDRLTAWHRRNGLVAVTLVVIHVPLTFVGRALLLGNPLGHQIVSLFGSRPGMITASVGTAILVSVVVSSLIVVRRRLRYETWYFIHLSVYAGVLLAYFHQVLTGNEFAAHPVQRDYWYGLYLFVVVLLVGFRLLAPAITFWRHRLHVVEVRRESPRVVSIYMHGRNLGDLQARGGQFFLWRFLTRSRWWQAHPFSLSAAPDGRSLRITVKDVGDYTKLIGQLNPGTRVLAEGPFGTFLPVEGGTRGVALIAGGIGITPLRAMVEELIAGGRAVTLIYRVLDQQDLVLRDELIPYELEGKLTVVNVMGDRMGPAGESLLSSQHLLELAPDLAEREIFLCGPPGMMRHVRASLISLGVPDGRVHIERFALAADLR